MLFRSVLSAVAGVQDEGGAAGQGRERGMAFGAEPEQSQGEGQKQGQRRQARQQEFFVSSYKHTDHLRPILMAERGGVMPGLGSRGGPVSIKKK